MLNLYKKRNFADIFNDTLAVFKLKGKNYFANYFIVNGGLLLLLALIIYLISRVFFENIFLGINTPQSQQMLNNYFDSNLELFIGGGIAIVLLLIVISILNYSFPVLYLNLLEKGIEPNSNSLLKLLKEKLGRILAFSFMFLITFIPIAILVVGITVLLSMVIIGIPLLFIVFPGLMCWIFLSFYVYLNQEGNYFKAMGKGFSMLMQNFWVHIGATLIIYVILYILQSIVSFIPYIIGLVAMLMDAGNSTGDEKLGILGVLILVTLIFSILLSYILGNILAISQGMIYYSCEEENKNHSLHSEIDLIGTDSE